MNSEGYSPVGVTMYKTRSQSHQRGHDRRQRVRKNSEYFENQIERKTTIGHLYTGKIVKGKVIKLFDYGALVDIGNVVGFVHISEISDMRVEKLSDHIKLGRSYDFKIIEIGLNKKGELSTKLTRKFETRGADNGIARH